MKMVYKLVSGLLIFFLLTLGVAATPEGKNLLSQEEVDILMTMGFTRVTIAELTYLEASPILELYRRSEGKARLLSPEELEGINFNTASSSDLVVRMFYVDDWVSGSLRYLRIYSQANYTYKPNTAAIGTVWENYWNLESVNARYSYMDLFGTVRSRDMSTLVNRVSYLGVAHSHSSWPSYVDKIVLGQDMVLSKAVNFSQGTWLYARAVDSVSANVSFTATFSSSPLQVNYSPINQIKLSAAENSYYLPD